MTDEHASGEPATPQPRRRQHRRAYGGTVPREPEVPAGTASDRPEAERPAPVGPAGTSRAPDDTDVGWGERPDPDDDERFLREVPPHW